MSFSEGKLLYRRNVANAIFKKESLYFSWLQTRWFVLFISIFKALLVGIFLLIALLQWNEIIIKMMFLDIVLLLIIYQGVKRYLNRHTKQGVNQIVSRRVAGIINIVIMLPVLTVVMLYSMPPEYLNSSLKQTLILAQSISQIVPCDLVSILLSYDSMRDGFGWWLMTKASFDNTNTTFLLLSWTLFLSLHTIYIWVFSKLILSTTIPFHTLFSKFKNNLVEDENISIESRWYQLNSFSLGFFGAIILLLTLTLTFLVDEFNIQPLVIEQNKTQEYPESKLVELLDNIDALANSEKKKNIDKMNHFIEVRVNQVFYSVYANIPKYVDTQYTLYRDYISLYQVIKKELSDTWDKWSYFVNKHIREEKVVYPSLYATESYAQRSTKEVQHILFGNGSFDIEIETLSKDTHKYMKSLLHKSQSNLSKSITDMQENSIYVSNITYIGEVNKAIEGTFIQVTNELNKLSSTYKIGQAGVSIILTKTIMTKLLAKSGIKIVAKGGGFIAGSTAGLAVCAPSGPWAIACGAVTGTLTWVGVDLLVNEVDEVFTREDFEVKLHDEIDRNKEALIRAMQKSYIQGIYSVFNDINSEIKRPIDMIKR